MQVRAVAPRGGQEALGTRGRPCALELLPAEAQAVQGVGCLILPAPALAPARLGFHGPRPRAGGPHSLPH